MTRKATKLLICASRNFFIALILFFVHFPRNHQYNTATNHPAIPMNPSSQAVSTLQKTSPKKMKTPSFLKKSLTALLAGLVSAGATYAQNSTWNFGNYSGGSWSTAGNWLGGTPTASNTAIFSNAGDQIVTVGNNTPTGGVLFSSSGSFANDYYFSGGGFNPANGATIQSDSTYRGVAVFSQTLAPQGNLTLTANGQSGSALYVGGNITPAASLGNINLNLSGTNTGFHTGFNNLVGAVIGTATGTTLKVVKEGTGSWVLGGVNTYTGGTDLNGGTIILGNAAALSTTGTIAVLSNSTIRTAVAPTDFSSRLTINDGATLTYDTSNVGSSMAGVIGTSGGSNTAAFTKTGLGELTFTMAGGSQTWRGDTTINAGNFYVSLNGLSAADRTNVLSADSRLVLGGGALRWQGKVGNTTNQTFSGTQVNAGVSQIISASSSGINNINIGAISRNSGGLLNIINAGNFTYSTSSSNDGTGAIKGLIWSSNDFGRVNAGNLAAATYTTQNNAANWTSGTTLYTTGATVSGTVGTGGTTDIGGLKLNFAGSNSFTIDGTLRTSNGIFFGSSIGNNASEISGGSLTSTSGDLIIVNNNAQNNYTRNTISSTIVDNGSATNVIFYNAVQNGSLFISGNNTYTGNTTIGGGQNNQTGSSLTVIGGAAGASIGSTGKTVFVNGGTGGTTNALRIGNNDATGDVKGVIDLANGRLSLARTDTFTLSATVRSSIRAGAISQDSTGNATVNLASGGNSFLSLSSSAAGTLNLAGSGTYNFLSAASGFNAGSTTNFNSGTYYFGALGNSGSNTVGNWNINGGNVILGGARAFNAAGGNLTLNSGSFRTNGAPISGESQGAGNIRFTVNGGTFTTVNNGVTAGTQSLALGTTSAATGSTIFDQTGGDVIIGLPANTTATGANNRLLIGAASSVHESTYALSGGKLRTFGAIEGGGTPTTGTNNFNWTGGTLIAASYNGTFLTSNGTTGTLVQNGAAAIMSPGDLYEGTTYTGRSSITGNYTINAGTILLGIGGTTAATGFHQTSTGQFDNVSVTGTATLGGNLTLSLLGGYTPVENTTFTILTAGSISGIFTGLANNSEFSSGGQNWKIAYNPTNVVLTAVPEPATWVLLALGLTTVVVLRRRSRA
jgi:fibronectin-binding autotransporter adhesin